MDSQERRLDRFVHEAPTSDCTVDFVEALEATQRLTKEQARLWKTAVRRLTAARQRDEPDDVRWMLENIDRLMQRIRVAVGDSEKSASEGTARSYRSRAVSAFKELLAFRKNPVAYANRAKVAPSQLPESTLSGRGMACRLDGGRSFRYQLPPNGLTRKDVERIAAHLWASAEDFNGKSLFSAQLALGLGDDS